MSIETVVAAREGDTFTLNGDEFDVGPKCDDDAGYWICTTHSEAFQHNLAKDSHINDNREHVLAWGCFTHGPEVP